MSSTNAITSAVLGDINGKFSEVFAKLAKLNSSHGFAFAIIAGNLFRDPSSATPEDNEEVAKLLKGEIEVSVPTYFALGNRALPQAVVEKLTADQGELCPNLSILGRKTSFKTSEGFRIVAIGGKHAESSDEVMDEYAATYTDKDVESAKAFKECDILITSDWPAGVRIGSKVKYNGSHPEYVASLGGLCAELKPRYHFSTSGAWFEREPFFHNIPPPRPITRFISLAPYGNPSKQKWIYAFSLEPSQPPPQHLPEGVTATPFPESKKRRLDTSEDDPNGFRFANTGHQTHHQDSDRPPRKRRGGGRRQHIPQPGECYFCLARAEAEGHLITSIGDEAYLTIAKGPLSTSKTFPSLDFPCHMLIIPTQHAPTIRAFSADTREATHKEMNRYRAALHNMISAKSTTGGADGKAALGAVTWEISRGGGVHLHWQFLPMPIAMIEKGLVEAAFDVEAENNKYPRFAKSEADRAEVEEGANFFKVRIWSEEGGEGREKEMILPLEEGLRFDFQFGRRVLGKLLGCEERAHWKDVVQEKEEEEVDAEKFRTAFEGYDPSE